MTGDDGADFKFMSEVDFGDGEGFKKEGVRILVVEDSPTQAEELKYILEQQGYMVFAASNGIEALEIIGSGKPTIIISDIVMPEMDGFALCRVIKSDKALKHIPLILLTSLSDPEDVLRGLECGADNFVTKPVDEKYLLSRIRYILINAEIRSKSRVRPEVEIFFKGQSYLIASDRRQILDLLLSTYEAAVLKNLELKELKGELEALNENLERKVEERTAELIAEIKERSKVEEEIKRLNLELEQRVVERTAQLEAANKELEAFNYSISHDLRAPLRIIDGFTQIVMEDHAARIDEEGKKLLAAVSSNVHRMEEMILAMLALSRSGRQKIQTEEIDMETLVKSVIDDLLEPAPERKISFTVGSLPIAHGDASLVRQVFANLLSNALKFTGKKDHAEVEVKGWDDGSENIYCVKDNGAGFDKEHTHRLFQVFQRLHSRSEFDGTGIGLSIVQKIVQRHGGRLWAEGAIDKGATFCFTLPKQVS